MINEYAVSKSLYEPIEPKSIWLTINNTQEFGYLRVYLIINGIEEILFNKKITHLSPEEGVILESHQLTYLLNSLNKKISDARKALEYYARDPHIEEGHICDPSPELAKSILTKLSE